MYDLLENEKEYLKELKNSTPINQSVTEYLDYLDFMEPMKEIMQEIDLDRAALNNMLRQKHRVAAKIKAAKLAGNKDLVDDLGWQMKEINGRIADHKEMVAAAAKRVAKAAEKTKKAAEKTGTVSSTLAQRTVARAKRAGEIVSKQAKELSDKPGAKYVAAGVIAAAAAVVAYKVYKRFFSQAAKACKGKSGSEKTSCMNQHKAKGLKAAKAEIMKASSKCSKAKEPEKCKAQIKKKALKYDEKIKKLSG